MTSVTDILWTSGWDSTFRVADLLLNQGRAVQPWYVMDPGRRSTKRELVTLDRMCDALEAKDPAVAELLRPAKVHRLTDIPADPDVTAKRDALAARSRLGEQYDWLARLAEANDVTLELCIHRDDKAHGFLEDHVTRDADGTYRLVDEPSDPALSIFSRFTFPVFETTKVQMQEQAARDGFTDVMEMTWFCFEPLLDGKPCGYCNPCQYTREEGLGRRVPAQTPARKAQRLALKAAWKVRQAVR